VDRDKIIIHTKGSTTTVLKNKMFMWIQSERKHLSVTYVLQMISLIS
jgi:hypothetical protein